MEATPSSSGVKPVPTRSMREWIVRGVLTLSMFFLLGGGMSFLRDYTGSVKTKLGLFLAIWAVVGLLWVYARRRYNREDELEILMNRRALAFAFYSALLAVGVLHQLQYIGLIPVLALRTEHIFPALMGLMAIGLILSKLRYR